MNWIEEPGRLVLTSTKNLLDEIQGFLKPEPGESSVFEELFAERQRERERD
jgi:hypothetical protein